MESKEVGEGLFSPLNNLIRVGDAVVFSQHELSHGSQPRKGCGLGPCVAWDEAREAALAAPAPKSCKVTGNPCGTDTWMVGHPCKCENCQEWLRAAPKPAPPAPLTLIDLAEALNGYDAGNCTRTTVLIRLNEILVRRAAERKP